MKIIKYTYEPYEDEDGETVDEELIDEDEYEVEDVDEAVDYLESEGASEPSSSGFHRGIWYNSYDYDYPYHHSSYHLEDFNPFAEQEVYFKLRGKGLIR
jgi:hypothetical protein